MRTRDKDSLDSGSFLRFAGFFHDTWILILILFSFSLENGPQLGTHCQLYSECLQWARFF